MNVTISADRLAGARALVEGMRDEQRTILVGLIEKGPKVRAKLGRGIPAMKELEGDLKELPKYLRASDVDDLIALDAPTMLERVLELPEFEEVRGFPFQIVWRRKAQQSAGRVIFGTCQAISERERLTWEGRGPAPFWRITLALDVWLLATEIERYRLLHHEAAHAAVDYGDPDDEEPEPKPTVKGHDVEDFTSTMGRFGPEFATELSFIEHAVAHPKAAEFRAEFDARGNGLLFPEWNPLAKAA